MTHRGGTVWETNVSESLLAHWLMAASLATIPCPWSFLAGALGYLCLDTGRASGTNTFSCLCGQFCVNLFSPFAPLSPFAEFALLLLHCHSIFCH